MKILRLTSVKGFILLIYWSKDQQYRFEIIDSAGKFYLCPDPFFHLMTAKTEAFSLIDRAIHEMEGRNRDG
ncbi:MAG: hypothetical protein AAFQ80_04410 [Cyanobacteria bacterium J06621_8]